MSRSGSSLLEACFLLCFIFSACTSCAMMLLSGPDFLFFGYITILHILEWFTLLNTCEHMGAQLGGKTPTRFPKGQTPASTITSGATHVGWNAAKLHHGRPACPALMQRPWHAPRLTPFAMHQRMPVAPNSPDQILTPRASSGRALLPAMMAPTDHPSLQTHRL